MATESRTPTRNPKTQTIRKMLDHERRRITLLWVLSHKGIPGNEKADQAKKETLVEDMSTTERYSQDDLKKWFTEEDFKKKKPKIEKRDRKKKARRRQKGGYKKYAKEKASGRLRMEGVSNPLRPFYRPIYPSTTYCGNAKKLMTREQT
jgi:hypothetical protein